MGRQKRLGVYINMINCKLIKLLSANFKANDINLTTEQFVVMDTLWRQGMMPQGYIAQMMRKDKNSITQFIDTLEKKGLVERRERPNDRRVNDVKVTEAGAKLRGKTLEVATPTMNKVFDGLTQEELDMLEKILIRINSNIDDIANEN